RVRELIERRGNLDSRRVPDVRAVEHVARAEVVRQGEILALDLADLDERGQQLVATELRVQRREVTERTDGREGRRLRVADLDDVGGVRGVGQCRRERGDEVAPLLLLDDERR